MKDTKDLTEEEFDALLLRAAKPEVGDRYTKEGRFAVCATR